jgi:hypothetical protein
MGPPSRGLRQIKQSVMFFMSDGLPGWSFLAECFATIEAGEDSKIRELIVSKALFKKMVKSPEIDFNKIGKQIGEFWDANVSIDEKLPSSEVILKYQKDEKKRRARFRFDPTKPNDPKRA